MLKHDSYLDYLGHAEIIYGDPAKIRTMLEGDDQHYTLAYHREYGYAYRLFIYRHMIGPHVKD